VLALTLCLLLAGLVWGAAGALAADPSASPGADKVVLRVGWTNDPDNLNPFVGYETSSYEIWMLNYDFLVGYDESLNPAPGLATEWSVSDDGLTWTFKLREGVTWQDGEAFTADDVKFTYDYIIDNEMGAFSAYTTLIDSVNVIDDATVEFVCSKPKANMLRTWIPVLPEHLWSKVKPSAAGSGYANKPPIIGTGPFQVVEREKGDYTRMVANPSFWGGEPAIDEILFITYQNADSMTQDLTSGKLDAAWGIPSAQFPQLQNDPNLEAIAYNLMSWDYLAFNCYTGQSRGHPALTDPAFRQALNYAIDKQRLVDVAWSGRAKVGASLMTPDTWVDPDYHWEPSAEEAYPFDPAMAAELLDAAGYKDGDGDGLREGKDGKPIKLRLWARAESPESQKQGNLIAGWLEDLGLELQYQIMDDGVYYDAIWAYDDDSVYSPDFDMYLWDWDGYADPGDTLASFTTAQIEWWNETCWSNEEFDGLVKQIESELDPETRKELVWNAQQVMYEQSPMIVLSYPDKLEAVDTSRWDGWTRMYGGTGAAFYTSYVRDSYLNLKPKEATSASSGGSSTTWIVVGVAALLVAVLAVWILLRRKPAAVEE
jgi:peptide/nickel transport system substrate-binding protein